MQRLLFFESSLHNTVCDVTKMVVIQFSQRLLTCLSVGSERMQVILSRLGFFHYFFIYRFKCASPCVSTKMTRLVHVAFPCLRLIYTGGYQKYYFYDNLYVIKNLTFGSLTISAV